MSAKLILLVDDSRVARIMTRKMIAKAFPDWTIEEAGSGEEAVEMGGRITPDIVLLDFNMPGMNGLETAEHLLKMWPQAAISLLTANIQEPVRVQASNMGLHFLNKPVTEDILVGYLAGGAA